MLFWSFESCGSLVSPDTLDGWHNENLSYWLDKVLVRYNNLAEEIQAKIMAMQAAQRQYWTIKALPTPESLGLFLKPSP